MSKFKESFEKTAGFAQEAFSTVSKGLRKTVFKPSNISKFVKGLGPTEATKKIKMIQHMKKMKAAGISDDQIKATVEKVRAAKAAKAAQNKVYDAAKIKKDFISKQQVQNKAKRLTPKLSTEPSAYAQEQAKKMAPRSEYRKSGLGTQFNPGTKTPINPTKTRKPF